MQWNSQATLRLFGIVLLLSFGCNDDSGKNNPKEADNQPNPSAAMPDQPTKKPDQPASKVSAENFLRITTDLPESDVMLILGPATETRPLNYPKERYEWHDDGKKIVVIFGKKSQELGAPTVVINKWQEGLQ